MPSFISVGTYVDYADSETSMAAATDGCCVCFPESWESDRGTQYSVYPKWSAPRGVCILQLFQDKCGQAPFAKPAVTESEDKQTEGDLTWLGLADFVVLLD